MTRLPSSSCRIVTAGLVIALLGALDNVTIDYRFGEGHAERAPALVAEVLKQGVDVLLAANAHVIRAARAAHATIPIVAIDLEGDPVAEGWVTSLARPGGNLTGLFLDIPDLSGKPMPSASHFHRRSWPGLTS